MNKRKILSLVVILSMPLFMVAQESQSKFHFGLKASPAFSWLRVDAEGLEKDGGRLGLSYGLMTEFAISKNYSFSTGLEIAYRGGKYSTSDMNGKIAVLQKLQYVEIPIGLKLKTNEIGYITYFGHFGALPGVLVRARYDVDYESELSGSDANDIGNQSYFYAINAHLNVGAGIEYNIGGSTSLTAGIYYNNGLMDVYKGPKDSDISAQLRTDAIVLNLGIFF
ncbi:MAG: porin family protein [Bacteroidota bacterium]|jgi:hypothetical protein